MSENKPKKFYLEVLSCLVKISEQLNKPKIQNMIIEY